jgi:hypothetical protein
LIVFPKPLLYPPLSKGRQGRVMNNKLFLQVNVWTLPFWQGDEGGFKRNNATLQQEAFGNTQGVLERSCLFSKEGKRSEDQEIFHPEFVSGSRLLVLRNEILK